MSDNVKSNYRIDPFCEYIRDRLVDKPTSPDADCWDKIDARLYKKRAISPVVYGLAIAASIIVAVFVINITRTENEHSVQNKMAVVEATGVDNVTQEDNNPMVLREDESSVDLSEDKKHVALKENQSGDIYPEIKTTDILQGEKTEDLSQNEVEDSPQEKAENASEDVAIKRASKELPSVQKETGKQQYKGLENIMAYNTIRSKKNKDWQLSAGFGSVGGAGSFLSYSKGSLDYDYPMDASPDFSNEFGDKNGQIMENENGEGYIGLPVFDNGNKDIFDNLSGDGDWMEDGHFGQPGSHYKDKITEIRPSIPISFGIAVRKNIHSTIGIETGLVYTYLSTDMTIIDDGRSEVTLKLHYLGVPANLIVNLYDKSRWNIYASAGGMIEKGLVSVSQSKNYSVYKNSKITNNRSISGLQWSLNGGVGLSYGIYKDINLYIEPGVSYYFDNDQPVSKRTEDPFSFNLRVGLRYDF